MAMNKRELVEKVYNEILLINTRDNETAITASDVFIKDFMSSQGYSEGDIKHALNILVESHKIFAMTLHKENPRQNIKRVEAYIVSEPSILHQLKLRFQNRLIEVYKKEKHKNLPYSQIVKEFLSNINVMAGSPLGKLANITIMLNEYENLAYNHSEEYSEGWKEAKLNEIIKSLDLFGEKEEVPASESPVKMDAPEKSSAPLDRRAVHSDEFEKFQEHSKTLSPEKVLRIYGPSFFFRVKLRKYEFLYLAEIIEKGYIKDYRELIILKNMLKTIKSNFERDPVLNEHFQDIYKLDRIVSKAIFFIK